METKRGQSLFRAILDLNFKKNCSQYLKIDFSLYFEYFLIIILNIIIKKILLTIILLCSKVMPSNHKLRPKNWQKHSDWFLPQEGGTYRQYSIRLKLK